MKTSIVFFYRGSPLERHLIRSLESAGFTVATARTPASMHDLFSRKTVSVVIVPRSVFLLYRIGAHSHIAEAHSTIAVIAWARRRNGTIATRIASAPEESRNPETSRENRYEAERAALLLRAAGTEANTEEQISRGRDDSYRTPEIIPDLPGIHRKMRLVLEEIAAAGMSGASAETIVRRIWPDSRQDRISDLQSYVSKLRRELENSGHSGLRILCEKRRYRLVRRM